MRGSRLFSIRVRKHRWQKLLNYSQRLHRLIPDSQLQSLPVVLCCCVMIMLLVLALAGPPASSLASSSSLFTRFSSSDSESDFVGGGGADPRSSRHLLATSSQVGLRSKYVPSVMHSGGAGSPPRLQLRGNKTYIYEFDMEALTCSLKEVQRNFTPSAQGIAWETCEYEESTNLVGLWIAFYVVIIIILFIGIAVVCDDFFVPSLEAISEKLKLSEDVAGATFMAAGSSAPELFSSVAAVTFESDVGVATIAGSAVFNLFVIISFTALFAGRKLTIDWRPLTRDAFFYSISIAYLIFAVWDTVIQIWDSVILLCIYIIYIITMVFNAKLMEALSSCSAKCSKNVEPNNAQAAEAAPSRKQSNVSDTLSTFKHDRRHSVVNVIAKPHDRRISVKSDAIEDAGASNGTLPNGSPSKQFAKGGKDDPADKKDPTDDDNEEDEEAIIHCCKCCGPKCPPIRGSPPKYSDLEKTLSQEESKRCEHCTARFVYGLKWTVFVLACPFLVLFSYTIPECSKPENRKFYLLSFFMSVIWIAALSFAMVLVVARTGCLIGVDSFVMALVILAAGTSIPDLISSVIVAREGYGDMAVSNAIGSNVFDIALGLGLPFLIRNFVNAIKPINMFSFNERQSYCSGKMQLMPLPKFGFILMGLLFIAYITFIGTRFRLNKGVGISFIFFYLAFLAYSFIQEFVCNIPGKYNC